MAKKRATKKNLSFESLDVVDFKKTTDLEAGKSAVGAPEIQKEEEQPVAVIEKKEIKVSKQKSISKEKEQLIRTTIDFTKSEHRQLKILAMNEDQKLYQYLYGIIRNHLDNLA